LSQLFDPGASSQEVACHAPRYVKAGEDDGLHPDDEPASTGAYSGLRATLEVRARLREKTREAGLFS